MVAVPTCRVELHAPRSARELDSRPEKGSISSRIDNRFITLSNLLVVTPNDMHL